MWLYNNILLVAGSLVGATGIILTNSMCKAMNRSLANVLFSGFGAVKTALSKVEGEVKPITPDDAYYILEAAGSVVVVPGYGMAVAQAQHVVKELLEHNGADVSYAIHRHARTHERAAGGSGRAVRPDNVSQAIRM